MNNYVTDFTVDSISEVVKGDGLQGVHSFRVTRCN